jgi:hypothetical protein
MPLGYAAPDVNRPISAVRRVAGIILYLLAAIVVAYSVLILIMLPLAAAAYVRVPRVAEVVLVEGGCWAVAGSLVFAGRALRRSVHSGPVVVVHQDGYTYVRSLVLRDIDEQHSKNPEQTEPTSGPQAHRAAGT